MTKNLMTRQRRVLIATLVFFLLTLSRFILFHQIEFDPDEVWNIWQTFGSPSQIIAWTPYDWPPLSFLVLGSWQSAVGIHPVILRVLPALTFLVGAAFTYRLAKDSYQQDTAAWGSVLAYGALGYIVFLSTNLRGYYLLIAIFPLALWLVKRYFETDKRKYGILLGVVMALLFYIAFTAVLAFAILGLYMLIFHWRKLLRWWLPGAVSLLLVLPLLLDKALNQASRRATVGSPDLLPYPEAMLDLFQQFTGTLFPLWLLIIGLCLVWLLWRQKRFSSRLLFFVLWVFAAPTFLHIFDKWLAFFQARYMWWILVGIALLVGWGISLLPRKLAIGVVAFFAILNFVPQPLDDYRFGLLPFEEYLSAVSDEMRPGDVLVIDPNCPCGRPYQWDYYSQVYFPNGLAIVDAPSDYRRVWYLRADGWEDEDFRAQVEQGRIASVFQGPWNFLIRLYVGPPDTEGIPFDNGLRFHGVDVVDDNGNLKPGLLAKREGEAVRLRLWWSVDKPLDAEYSVALHVPGGDGLFMQSDGAPQLIHLSPVANEPLPQSMTQWQPGQLYVEERELQIPFPTNAQDYDIYLIVYQWWDGERISAPGQDEENRLKLLPLSIKAW
ncbi:MAG: hypothetical protein D6712_05475 [Chloroflexi bacterium]|nr:MAG: hypothetical protein D6712_05475 [Chloroflexota bacterium]